MTGVIAFLTIIIIVGSYFADEPLRRYMERKINATLKDYSVDIEKLSFHPIGLSLDLSNFVLRQKANPTPPVAEIERIHASLHWGAILHARVVGDFEMTNPKFYINLKNLKTESARNYPIKREDWQDVALTIYPLQINEFRITNGEFTYIDVDPSRPLKINSMNAVAHNIRNVRQPNDQYPSEIQVQAVLLNSGKLDMAGRANFLLKPFMGINVDATLEGMDLTYFKPIAERKNIAIRRGTVALAGHVEFAPKKRIFNIKNLTIDRADAEYFHVAEATSAEKQTAAKAKETAKELANKPQTLIKAETIVIRKSEFGVVNKAKKPPYRIFLNDLTLEIKNFSNHFSEGPAELNLFGKFMGSGETTAEATFRPEKKGPDFNLNIAIQDTRMTSMNDLFRAYGNFDVTAGLFSFYSEMAVRNGRINGYVKPLFKDMKVYDKRKDKEKSEFHKLYEKIIGGIIKLFENPQKEVATQTPLRGNVTNPNASTWDIIINLIQNAFFRSILPGFEHSIPGGG